MPCPVMPSNRPRSRSRTRSSSTGRGAAGRARRTCSIVDVARTYGEPSTTSGHRSRGSPATWPPSASACATPVSDNGVSGSRYSSSSRASPFSPAATAARLPTLSPWRTRTSSARGTGTLLAPCSVVVTSTHLPFAPHQESADPTGEGTRAGVCCETYSSLPERFAQPRRGRAVPMDSARRPWSFADWGDALVGDRARDVAGDVDGSLHLGRRHDDRARRLGSDSWYVFSALATLGS